MTEFLWCEECNKMTLHNISNSGSGIMTICDGCKKKVYYVDENLLER